MLNNCGKSVVSNLMLAKLISEKLIPKSFHLLGLDSGTIFSKMIKIYWTLLTKFRRQLKNTIPVIISDIILGLLKNPASSVSIKKEISRFLADLLFDKQIVIDFYVNYDCDHQYPSLLKNIIDTLCK